MISVPMPMMQVPMTAVPLIGYQTAMLVPVLVVNQPIMEHTALPSMDSNSSFSSESSESISRQCSEQSRESTDSDLGWGHSFSIEQCSYRPYKALVGGRSIFWVHLHAHFISFRLPRSARR